MPSRRSLPRHAANAGSLVTILLTILGLLASPPRTNAAGINLSWDDCGASGAELKAFACDTNTGDPFALIGSFVAPAGMTNFLGLNAKIRIETSGPLPDWWKHGSSQCRGQNLGLRTSFDFTAGPFTCHDFFAGQAAGGFVWEMLGEDALNAAQVRLTCAVPFDNQGPLEAGEEYYAFKVLLERSRTVGSGSCVGCAAPALLTFQEIQLFQPPEFDNDPFLRDSAHRATVRWQGSLPPRITITSLEPAGGAPGTPVTIHGVSLSYATLLDFAGTPAPFTLVSDSVITTLVPAGARTGLVRVGEPGRDAYSPSAFIVAPAVLSFAPAQAPLGHVITIRGYNFDGATTLRFHDTPATFTVASDSVIQAHASAGGFIHVTNSGGTGTSATEFVVGSLPPPPAITSFTPVAGGPGATVTIAGEHFLGATRVAFGDRPAASFTVASATRIDAVVPGDARTGPITVETGDGIGASDSIFVMRPRITGVSPGQAPPGHVITIQGINFTRTLAVRFDDVSATFEEISDVELHAMVPTTAVSGPVVVENAGGTDTEPFIVGPTLGAGINLSWDDCGLAGNRFKVSGCASNTGPPFTAVASFVPPPGVDEFLGLSATLNFDSEDALLPDWWRFGTGQCRGSVGMVSFDFTSGPYSCRDVFTGQAAGGFVYEVGNGGPDRAQMRVTCAVPFDARTPVDPEVEHYAFRVNLPRSKTTGTGACVGCETPLSIVLASMQLFQPPERGFDPLLTQALGGTAIQWQPAGGAGPVFIASFDPTTGPAGTVVTIQGHGFTGATAVRFATQLASFTVASDSVVFATAPPNVQRGPIEITTPQGSALSEDFFGPPPPVAGQGINLSWDDCGAAGRALETFACDSDDGAPFTLVASFGAPPGIVEFVGLNSQIDLRSSTASLPEFWRHGAGRCRGTQALVSSADFTNGPYTCADPWQGLAHGAHVFEYPTNQPNAASRGRVRVTFAIPLDAIHPLAEGVEHYAYKLAITRAQTSGEGACPGCDVPVCIVLDNIQLFQPPEHQNDPYLSSPVTQNFVTWQQAVPTCPLSTPALAAVADVRAQADRVTIVWQLEGLDRATVQRRAAGGTWQPVADVTADGLRRVTYEDRAVVAGVTYGYRLALAVGSGEQLAGETEVRVPLTAALALARAAGRDGAIAVTLALPSTAPATLEAYDVFGRRWASRSLTPPAAGEMEIDLRGTHPLRPGVWFLRLRQGEAVVSRRFVIVQ